MFPLSTMWSLQPFEKQDDVNPILSTNTQSRFRCPVRKEVVDWEGKDVFNPAAVVKDGKVYLLYRAEDSVGQFAGTSRIGLAVSDDGLHFKRHHEPVLYPDNTSMNTFEWEGGVEDPRIVEDENGTFIMTYTAYDGKTARLCVATSKDLYTWSKQGLVFGNDYADMWCKAGAIVCRREDDRLIATRVNGKYYMYWGESHIFVAESDDLIRWKPIFYDEQRGNYQDYTKNFVTVIKPRRYRFDSSLVEPGPPAILTEHGILLIYHGRNDIRRGDTSLPDGTYAGGQILLDRNDPTAVTHRLIHNFFRPEKDYEITGQVGNVCFMEGLVYFQEKWFLYYGTADSNIAVAIADMM